MFNIKDFSELTRVQIPALIHLTRLGYSYLPTKNLFIDSSTGILKNVFQEQFSKFNPKADFEKEYKNIVAELDQEDLGKSFYKRLINGDNMLIDFKKASNNVWHISPEIEHEQNNESFRPDITVFINGLPLVFIEVKQPNVVRNGMTGIQSEAKRTLERLKKRAFRKFNNITQLMIFSDNMDYDSTLGQYQGAYYTTPTLKGGMFNSFKEQDYSIFNIPPIQEKTIDFILNDLNKQTLKNSKEFETNLQKTTPTNKILTSLLSKERILFFIQYGLAYVDVIDKSNSEPTIQKHIMRYPQFFATKAIENTLKKGSKKGIIWHTQGSGKTALTYYNIRYLRDLYQNDNIIPHFYFIVDRLDLANQATEEFVKRGLSVKKISSPEELNKPFTHDIAVVNIQKFKNETDFTNNSGYELREQNIYFIDEAHRSYNPKGSYLANLYNSDLEAIKIALTGTPLIAPSKVRENKIIKNADIKSTRRIFGDYIHKYYYNDSIADGFTLRLIREDIATQYKAVLKQKFEEIKIKQGALATKDIYAHPKFVAPMLHYIIEDFNEFQIAQGDNTTGAMIVAHSSEQAKELYNQFNQTYGKKYNYTGALVLYDQEDNVDKVKSFKQGDIDFIIVQSMLLTGFDAPRLKKIYLGRKIRAHNLLQTLTRVNRPYRSYKQGYVVDFADISKEFDETNQAYLEELTREYNTGLTDEESKKVFGSLLVSYEEIQEKLDKANRILLDYPTDNLESFSEIISDINDRKSLNQLRLSLIDIKDNFQLARLLGYKNILENIDIGLITRLLNILTQRITTLNLLENVDDTSNEELLNIIMNEANFEFIKVGESELELAANDLQETKKNVVSALVENWDKKDPNYVTLIEEFKRIMNKHNALEFEDLYAIKSINKEYEKLLQQIIELNRNNKKIVSKYNGDKKFARVAKKVNLNKPSDNITLYYILKESKENIDEVILNNKNILDNDNYFTGKIKEIVGASWRNQNDKHKVTPKILTSLSRLVSEEYLNEYEGVL